MRSGTWKSKRPRLPKDGFKLVAMYKVAGQRRVIALAEMETAEDLDRVILGRLPLREVLEFEAIWPLRSFESFLEDCRTHFGAKEAGDVRTTEFS
jgi:hypothetical protein